MIAARAIVAMTWSGARVLRRIGSTLAEQQQWVGAMDDDAVTASLTKLNVDPIPPTPQERQARLASWPNQQDLDAMADALVAENDGVRPTVRVLEGMHYR